MSPSTDFDRLVPAIYEASTAAEAWPDVLETIRRGADVTTALLGILPTDRMWEGIMWGANLDPASVVACMLPGIIDQSVFAHALLLMPRGTLVGLRAAGDQAVQKDPGAQALLKAQSLTEGLFGTVTRDSGQITGLACLNDTRQGAMNPDAVRWIEALVPHLSRSLAVSRRIEQLHREAVTLRSALGRLEIGVMSVTAGLNLRYKNAEAERILGADDGLAQRSRHFRVSDTGIKTCLRATIGRRRRRGPNEIHRQRTAASMARHH